MRRSDTRTPCPTCGYAVNNDRPRADGMRAVVCMNCGAWLLAAGESEFRTMTRTEVGQLPPAVQSTLTKASRLILQKGMVPALRDTAARD
jgi:hypothetical protein